ncbi:T9SS type A sorting domain-containing protein [uncultured Flavobacterium sp.]|uniref:T9SS type A sorting domain-containing protein n=1 Tax=uncultured Flavobacterium sp. TaxID=165435 RepID=UPI0025E750CC|nr:T9SS type A sorting domain-containing protein [uncultured Flavobacterium sp.]
MKRTSFRLFSILSLFSIGGIAHAQDLLWEKSYGGKHADYLFDAVATPDYGFLLAGSSLSRKTGNKTAEPQGGLDYWVWKMDEHGELDWQKGFGGPGTDLLQAVRLTRDAGFLLAGTSDSGEGLQKKDACKGMEDFWVVKLDAKGGEQWQRTLGGSGQEQLSAAFPTSDGGYILGGSSSSEKSPEVKGAKDPFGKWEDGFGSLDYWAVKLDSKGKVEWQRTIGGEYADQLRSIIQTRDGGYLLAGYSNSPESGNKTEKCYGQGDYFIVKLDKEGNTEWQKAYGGDGDDQPYALLESHDGNFVIAGNSNSGTTGNKNSSNKKGTDFWMLKIDASGEILWQETYDIGNVDLLTSLVENKDHSLLLGGYAQSETMGTKKKDKEGINDYVVLKTDENGEEKWRQHAGSSGEDILRKAIETRDGGYLLAGTSKGEVSRDRNTGKGNNDFWVVKLRDKDKKKEDRKSIEAFPNPAVQYTNVVIGYDFVGGTGYVYDLSGRQLQSFEVKDRTVPVDLGSYPEGIYLIKIKTEVQEDSVKVMKSTNKN